MMTVNEREVQMIDVTIEALHTNGIGEHDKERGSPVNARWPVSAVVSGNLAWGLRGT